jgi:hypothetical protein
MNMTDLYIRQLQRRLERLDEDPDLVFDASEMKKLLGDEYGDYSRSLEASFDMPEPHLGHLAKLWWIEAEKLLKSTTRALNLGHVTVGPQTAKQKRRTEELQSRAEELMHQFNADIRGTNDQWLFTICEMADVGYDNPYAQAHQLLEHWVLPTIEKPAAVVDPKAYKRQMQREALRQIIGASNPSTVPVTPEPANTAMREFLEKRKKENRYF